MKETDMLTKKQKKGKTVAMEFWETITKRRAIRAYKSDPIPEETMEKLYKALQAAPSGNNRQPYKFIFVKDDAKRQMIAKKACHQEFIAQAPVLMIACCEKGRAFDVAIAVDHMILAATDAGLGTCWIGWFERDEMRKLLGIPEDKEIPIMVTIGYPGENPPVKERKPISELIQVI